MRVRGVVLAAGLGTRLRPLTHTWPKPLLPVVGAPVLSHALAELEAAGCEAVAINLHYQGEKIRSRFGSRFGEMELVYSPEEKLLGTLGALAPLETFLQDADRVVLVNGDSLCEWPLKRLLKQHEKQAAAATLLFSSRAKPAEFGGGVAVDASGRVVSFAAPAGGAPSAGDSESKGSKRLVFAGAHVFEPSLVAGRPVEPADIVADLYRPMVERGEPIAAFETGHSWQDLGTPGRYLRGVLGWAQHQRLGLLGGLGSSKHRALTPAAASSGRYWVAADVEVGEEATIKRSVVEAGCTVDTGAYIDGSVLLPGAQIGQGARVRNSIVGFSVRVPAGTNVEGRLVTAARADTSPGEKDSVVGGLVYSPL